MVRGQLILKASRKRQEACREALNQSMTTGKQFSEKTESGTRMMGESCTK